LVNRVNAVESAVSGQLYSVAFICLLNSYLFTHLLP